MKNKLAELFEKGVTKDGHHFDILIQAETSEFSARARKKKRIYKRKKPEDRPTA